MDELGLFTAALGLSGPWRVIRTEFDAEDAGLWHVVWSTLEDTRPHFQRLDIDVPTVFDSYKVPHFDARGEANAFFTELGVPTTFLQMTFYYEAVLIGQGPHRNEKASWS